MSSMQLNSYSPDLMAIYRDYAASLGPVPAPAYAIVHDRYSPIQVPRGCLPIRIAQFAPSGGPTRLHQWAIFIPTSTTRGVGNFYEIAGTLQTGYFLQRVFNGRHPRWDRDERGSHLVGWVAPSFLATLEAHLSMVPIQQGKSEWNGQMWVVDALKGLNQSHLFTVEMEYPQWLQQMEIVEMAWEVGDDA